MDRQGKQTCGVQKNGRLFGMEPSGSKRLDFGRPGTLLDTNKRVYEI
jgi:hypothetical protein